MSKKTKISNRSKKLPLVLFVAIFVGLGTFFLINSFAASAPSLYLNPATQTIAGTTDFTVEVRENSGTTTVNGVTATLSYPATLLDFVSIDTTGGAFKLFAAQNGANGTVNISAAAFDSSTSSSYSLTGDQLVATVHFKSKTTAGAAAVNFASGSALVDATTNADILGSLSNTVGGTYTVNIDTAPSVSVTYPTAGAKVKGSITATANASDAQGVSNVQFKLDGANIGAADTTSPYSVAWNTTTATDGSHSITAVVTDTGSQTTTSSAVAFTVDNTAPNTTITSANPGTTSSTAASLTFTSSETGSTFECQLDTGTYAACTSPKAYSNLTAGSHTFNVRAIDGAGNVDATPATQTWTVAPVDTTVPTVSITAPANNANVSGANVAITATAADNVGVAGVQFYLDSTSTNGKLGSEDTTSPYSYTWNTTTLSNGTHTLTAIARDAAGNTGTSTTVTVNVNNVAPPTDNTAPSVPTNLRSTSTTNNSIGLAWNASTDSAGTNGATPTGVANYKLYKSTTQNGTYSLLNSTTTLNFTDGSLTASTPYYYKVAATDNAGNTSAQSASLAVTTAANPPPTPVPGDVDGNRTVDYLDLSQLLAHWNQSYPAGDFKSDGSSANKIDIYDLSILLSNYGRKG